MVENPFVHAGFEHGVGGVDAHAAGIGAGVALANAFVILCGDKGGNVFAVGEAEVADFFAFEELFNYDLLLGLAQQLAAK